MEFGTKNINRTNGFLNITGMNDYAAYKRIRRAKDNGTLLHLKRGLYADPLNLVNVMIDIESVVPKGIVCLYNAWAYYRLTTKVPPGFCVAVESKRKVTIPDVLPVTLYYWKKENLEFGVVKTEVSGHNVRITDLERSVCDAIKYRNKIGMDLCAEIVKSYLNRNDRNISKLCIYAKKLRVYNTLTHYLEFAMV